LLCSVIQREEVGGGSGLWGVVGLRRRLGWLAVLGGGVGGLCRGWLRGGGCGAMRGVDRARTAGGRAG